MKKATLLKPTISFLSFCNIVLDKIKEKAISDVVVELGNFSEKLRLITTVGSRKRKQKISRDVRMMLYTIRTINKMYIKDGDKEKIIVLITSQKNVEEQLKLHDAERKERLEEKNNINN